MARLPVSVGDKVPLVIERLSSGGAGVGRYERFVIFVPFSAPADRLVVQITEIKKNFAIGQILTVETPGPDRITPECPVFGRCGGCSWQHIEYREQLRQKQMLVEHILQRSPLLRDAVIEPIVASPRQWHYRNRIQLRTAHDKLGFFARDSHDIVDIHECAIAEDALNTHLQSLKRQSGPETFKIELMVDAKGEVRESINQPHGEEFGFTQVNSSQNLMLQKYVLELFSGLGQSEVLDLYCGHGNFSFPLAEAYRDAQITGVELNSQAIERANERLDLHPTPGLKFVVADVAQFLDRYQTAAPLAVLLDPPRIGCERATLTALTRLKTSKLVYVSCDPATFARDAEVLASHDGRKLTRVRPFDMFPHTDHIELVGLFI
jgi:23S rRNA (uracil1939-C5)-methyltransferase